VWPMILVTWLREKMLSVCMIGSPWGGPAQVRGFRPIREIAIRDPNPTRRRKNLRLDHRTAVLLIEWCR
jgi:hypothetical protein